jgi:hypothetical protein
MPTVIDSCGWPGYLAELIVRYHLGTATASQREKMRE